MATKFMLFYIHWIAKSMRVRQHFLTCRASPLCSFFIIIMFRQRSFSRSISYRAILTAKLSFARFSISEMFEYKNGSNKKLFYLINNFIWKCSPRKSIKTLLFQIQFPAGASCIAIIVIINDDIFVEKNVSANSTRSLKWNAENVQKTPKLWLY